MGNKTPTKRRGGRHAYEKSIDEILARGYRGQVKEEKVKCVETHRGAYE